MTPVGDIIVTTMDGHMVDQDIMRRGPACVIHSPESFRTWHGDTLVIDTESEPGSWLNELWHRAAQRFQLGANSAAVGKKSKHHGEGLQDVRQQ